MDGDKKKEEGGKRSSPTGREKPGKCNNQNSPYAPGGSCKQDSAEWGGKKRKGCSQIGL